MFTRFKAKNLKFKFAVIGVIVLLFSFAAFARGGSTSSDKFSYPSLSCDKSQWADSIYFSGDVNGCPDLIEFYLTPSYVDEKNSELINKVITGPLGQYGWTNTNAGLTQEAFTVDLDSVDTVRIINKRGDTTQGINSRSKMSTQNTLFYYPFDFYKGEIALQAIDNQSKSPIPSTITVGKQSLSGWIVKYKQSGSPEIESKNKIIYSDGLAKVSWTLHRANVIFIAIILLIILMLIALVSVFTITRSISNGIRPPSMNLLMWLATILFAIVQVRSNFPGNPPLGILIDYLIVFPVISLLLLLGIANTFFWLVRPDWDIENER